MQVSDDTLHGIIGACALYLISVYIFQQIKTAAHKRRLRKSRDDYEQAKQIQYQERQKLIDYISTVYGAEQAHYVAMGKLWIGMPMHLLMVARGKANNVKQSVEVDAIKQIWYYTDPSQPRGTNKNQLEVVLVNNEITNWKELS